MSDNSPSIRHLPPGLSATTIAHGFDAANWDFLYAPIFELSYKERDPDQDIGVVRLPHGSEDKDYDVPDGMTVLPHYGQHRTEAMIFRGVHSVDDRSSPLPSEHHSAPNVSAPPRHIRLRHPQG
jgi:hypothetical protein